jgi:hypothetical protein
VRLEAFPEKEKPMKSLTFPLILLLFAAISPAVAQPRAHLHDGPAPSAAIDAKAFDTLKTLAGSWVGQLTTSPKAAEVEGSVAQFSIRVTSRGNAVAHEFSVTGIPDHPMTMFYLDGGRLTLTHYCDAGNRPRMRGKLSPDGKRLEFEFVDLSGGDERGHMSHAVFTFIDDNHHTEEWTYLPPGGAPVRAHFDLRRTNFEHAAAR